MTREKKKQKLVDNSSSGGGRKAAGRKKIAKDKGTKGVHRGTKEQKWAMYLQQVTSSKGFKVDNFSYLLACNMVVPSFRAASDECICELARLAIQEYDKEHNTNHDFVRVKRANQQTTGGRRYFITFRAKDANDEKTFQADVYVERVTKEKKFKSIKLKPKKQAGKATAENCAIATATAKAGG